MGPQLNECPFKVGIKYHQKLTSIILQTVFLTSALRTKSVNQQLVIKLHVGDLEFKMGVFRIEDWGFGIEVWGGRRGMGKTPIPN